MKDRTKRRGDYYKSRTPRSAGTPPPPPPRPRRPHREGQGSATALHWVRKLQLRSTDAARLVTELARLSIDCQRMLNRLMSDLSALSDRIVIVVVSGYSPYGFHVKSRFPRSGDNYEVKAMIIPLKRNGVRVRVRVRLGDGWAPRIVDGQRLFEKNGITDYDIQRIVNYCESV